MRTCVIAPKIKRAPATNSVNHIAAHIYAIRRQDFSFQLTESEFTDLTCHFGISSWGGRRYRPWAFTEHGVAMLSAVLRSSQATQVSLAIVRTFVRLRRMLASNEDLARKVAQHDHEITILFDHVQALLEPPKQKHKHPIGFK
ncbi:MAG: ORF6N domain-containing protein [Acidobacteriota bacterium]